MRKHYLLCLVTDITSYSFSAKLDIIGINPFVFLPLQVLSDILKQAGKEKGNIRVRGTVNGKEYRQTLVRYQKEWRLYINQTMLKNSPKHIGETIIITIQLDGEDRTISPHPKFTLSLQENKEASLVFKSLRPSLQHEIIRYISRLKSEESIDKNIERAVNFLLGKCSFVGRKKPL